MKKIFIVLYFFLLIFSLTACSEDNNKNDINVSNINIGKTEISKENISENDIYWVGTFPFNKNEISNIKNVYENNSYSCSFYYNDDIEFYEKQNMDVMLKLRHYINFYSNISSNSFPNSKVFNTYYKLNADNKNKIEYIICLTNADNTNELLKIVVKQDKSGEKLEDFISLYEILNKIMFVDYNKYEKNEYVDYSEQNKNEYIEVETIYNLLNNQYIINNEIFGNEKTLPLNYEQTTEEEFLSGKIRVDVENSKYNTFKDLSNYINSTWCNLVSNYLLYYPNGTTYSYKRNDNGGLIAVSESKNSTTYYLEENNIFYSSAINPYSSDLEESIKNYVIEIVSVDNSLCYFKKWYRNSDYGIQNGYKYEEQFIYHEGIIVKENDQWKIGLLITNPDEYKEYGDIYTYYEIVKNNPEICYKNIF